MKQILKAYKYRIYPNKDQRQYLDQIFGACRFLWNQRVAAFNQGNTYGPNFGNATIKQIKETYPWLNNVPYNALDQKMRDFEETKSQFFNKNRKKKLGRPKFKKKGYNDSFRIIGVGNGKTFKKSIDFNTSRIKLPKITPIKIIIDRKFSGELRSVTISKNSCNQYFVSCLVKEEVKPKPKPMTGKSIGIDLGLIDLITTSDGQKVSNPKWFRESQAKLRKAQKHLSRKQHGSNSYEQQRLKVAKIHLKIKNQREWFLHNLSSSLVSNYDHIFMEDLNVSGMIKNRKLSKSISDVSWSELIRQIEYKSNWYSKSFHKIDRWYPSSKTCSCCGYVVDSLPLDIREWTCPECSIRHDRDINAAKNILNKGLTDLYGFTSSELDDYKRGEDVRHASSDAILSETFSSR